ncbi:hypothetical protein [Kocuria marina]|uniref:hypothetical protein n=1 Tax=Kocuria marina TaxID=223184 RepID=UPI000BF0F244
MARNAKELIELLVERGMSQTEIAEELQRDQSLISQVRRGKKPGANLVTTLEEIATTGRATTRPQRRQTSHGVARIRGKKGQEAVVPPDAPQQTGTRRKVRRRVEVPPRGSYRKDTVYGRGVRTVRIDFPRTKGSKGKERAWEEASKSLTSIARKKWGRKELPERRVYITATYEDGSKVDFGSKGGYQPHTVLGGLGENDGDVEKWLKTQGLQGRYADLDPDARMVSLEINGYVR